MKNVKQRKRQRKPYYSDREYRGQYERNPGNQGPRYAHSESGLFRSPGYGSWDEFGEGPDFHRDHHQQESGRNMRKGDRGSWRNPRSQQYPGPHDYKGDISVGSDWGYGNEWDRVAEGNEGERHIDPRTPGIDTRTESYGTQDHNYRQRTFGRHRGKGPKGYKRSDERIREDISDEMSEDGMLDASTIEVNVDEGDVILTGDVLSREDKRRAEDIAESVLGTGNVENRIRVRPESFATNSQNDNL